MTTQLVRTPATFHRNNAWGAVALYLWLRVRKAFPWFALAWIAMAIGDDLFFAGQIGRFLHGGRTDSLPAFAAISYMLTIFIIPILAILAPIGIASNIEDHLWGLPVPTKTLARALVLYGAAASVTLWLMTVYCIWRPTGIHPPLLWPAMMLIAMHGAALACRFLFATPPRYFITMFALFALPIGGGLAAVAGVSETTLALGYMATAAAMYALVEVGAVRTRQGARPIGEQMPGLRALPIHPTPFASKHVAQGWAERGMEKWYLTGFITYMNLVNCIIFLLFGKTASQPYAAAILPAEFLTNHARHIYSLTYGVSSWANTAPFTPILLMLIAPPIVSILTIHLNDKISGDSSFLKVRPLRVSEWVAVKLRVCAHAAVVLWLSFLPVIALWVACPVRMSGRLMRLGAAVLGNQDLHSAVLIVALLLGLMFLTWKLLADCVFLIFTARSQGLRHGSLLCYVASILLITVTAGVNLHASEYTTLQTRTFATQLLMAGTLIKISAVAAIVSVLIRRELLNASELRRIFLPWTVTALVFTGLFSAALAPYHIAAGQVALDVILLMPGVRLALAPLALAWDRSR